MSGIVWLASYPKSGNTWVRAFLANYRKNADAPVSVNELYHFSFGDDLVLYYTWMTGREAGSFSSDELWRLRPRVHRYLAGLTAEPTLVKTHNVAGVLDNGQPIITPDVTDGAVYVVRNPLDVAVSFAHHYQLSFDEAVDRLSRSNDVLPGQPPDKLPQLLGDWSQHVRSWVAAPGLNPLVLRYEDMLAAPRRAFRDLVSYMGLPLEIPRLRRAISFSRFDRLRAEESETGFNEARPDEAARFFRRGQANQWRETLTRAQADRLVAAHGEMMSRFGYLDKKGRPL
jgi:hypothetical protein